MPQVNRITSSDDVNFWDASVIILDDSRIYHNPHYYQNGVHNDYRLDRIYRVIDNVEDMQHLFDEMTEEQVQHIARMNMVNGGFERDAKDAWWVSAYIAYNGCDYYGKEECYSYEEFAKLIGMDDWSYERMGKSALWGQTPKEGGDTHNERC